MHLCAPFISLSDENTCACARCRGVKCCYWQEMARDAAHAERLAQKMYKELVASVRTIACTAMYACVCMYMCIFTHAFFCMPCREALRFPGQRDSIVRLPTRVCGCLLECAVACSIVRLPQLRMLEEQAVVSTSDIYMKLVQTNHDSVSPHLPGADNENAPPERGTAPGIIVAESVAYLTPMACRFPRSTSTVTLSSATRATSTCRSHS
jgi:hypothetical protein